MLCHFKSNDPHSKVIVVSYKMSMDRTPRYGNFESLQVVGNSGYKVDNDLKLDRSAEGSSSDERKR